MTLEVFLRNDLERAVFDPVALLHRDAGPAHAADAVHLVALDSDENLAAAGIAADQAQLGAEDIGEEDRHFAQGRAFTAGPDNYLLGKRLLEGFGRRIGPQ